MKRAGVLAFALAGVVLGILLLFGGDKRAQQFFRRATEPARTSHGYESEQVPSQRQIDFGGKKTADNLFFAPEAGPGESIFQDRKAHQLTLDGLVAGRLVISTNDTFINYKNGKAVWVKVYLAADTVTYREAVRLVDMYLRRAGLGSRFDAREYDRHMGDVVDHEIWAPDLVLPGAHLTPQLNCNWEWHQSARTQVDRVACRPLLSITVPDEGGGG